MDLFVRMVGEGDPLILYTFYYAVECDGITFSPRVCTEVNTNWLTTLLTLHDAFTELA